MAIKAYNAGTNNNLIDTSYKFQEGDMLVFDISKNLFTKGITRDQLATKEEVARLKTALDAFDQGHPVEWDKIQNVPNFLLPENLSGLASESYVLEKIASIATDGEIDLTEYITENEVINLINNIQHPVPDWNLTINKPTLFSGNYNDLINQPSIPTDISQLTDTTNLLNHFSGDYNDLTNKPVLFDGDYNSLINKPSVFSGNYNDLYNVPTIPSTIGLASEAYVQEQINLLDLSSYSTVQYVDDQIAAALTGGSIDLSSYVTESELTTALSNYQPTIDLSSYYTKTQVDNLIPTIPTDISQLGDSQGLLNHVSLVGYATEAYVQNQLQAYQPTIDLSSYALKTDLFSGSYNDLTDKPVIFSGQYQDLIGTPQIFSGDYNDLINQPLIPSIDGLASISYVDQQIANISSGGEVDLSSYVTETELQTTISNLDYYTKSQVDSLIQPNTDSQILSLNGSILTISGGNSIDIGSIDTNVDLAGYATELYVQQQIGNINTFSGDYNDLSNKPNIPTDVSQLTDTNGLLVHTTDTNTDAQTLSLSGNVLSISDGNSVDLTTVVGTGGGTGTVDLSGYATQTYVQQQISTAGLASVSNLNDLNDVAIDGTETTNHVLMYNAVNQLWENVDLDETFATRAYVTDQVANVISGGQINLSGYATTGYVDQKLLERGDHFSGNYNDLVNRPQLFSGDYNDLLNKPAGNSDLRLELVAQELQLINIEPEPDTIISRVNLSDLGTSIAQNINYNNISNLPDLFSGDYNDLVNKPVLFSGSYNDLANKPYIPSIAGLATEAYVDQKHSEPTIYGDKTFTGSITVRDDVVVKQSLSSHTAQKKTSALAIQTTDNTPTEVVYADGSPVTFSPNTTVMLTVTVVASGVDVSDKAAFVHKGIISVDSQSAQFVGVVTTETIESGVNAWDSEIYTTSGSDRILNIRVTGSVSHTVNWTVFLETHEVINL